ncbi:MAG: ferredoxin [Intestinibacter bartlettii]|uniref:ferredoxin n=1 Tax=Intestinibacter bartlettii TaxID=261299 RepID=UPI0026F0C8B5|nr:ferredoxin [Intestinibacter bartlettii]MDO5011623.1 ferredoxin [Intestinibacter bartlettii]
MRAFVDRDACIGCEACVGICPEVFSMDDDGISVAVEGEIAGDILESAEEAMDCCPVGAITVE